MGTDYPSRLDPLGVVFLTYSFLYRKDLDSRFGASLYASKVWVYSYYLQLAVSAAAVILPSPSAQCLNLCLLSGFEF